MKSLGPNAAHEILRHRAAIRRADFSLPVKCVLRDQLLRKDTSFFDFGCGHGDDVAGVANLGIAADGWDPAHLPDRHRRPSDVVNLGYVINVIEDVAERGEVLRDAWSLTKKVLVVAARIAVDGASASDIAFGDGVITRIGTFQKFYSQAELRLYIEATLGENAISAAPGVFYIFKDPLLQHSFTASKYRRRSVSKPRLSRHEQLFESNRELLETLIETFSELGRLPFPDEFEKATEIIDVFRSFDRAFAIIKKVADSEELNRIQEERADDIRVYLALARFPKRPSLGELPLRIQRDIKAFFRNYKIACDEADRLLFSTGNSELIDKACRKSPIGRLTSNGLLVHHSAISGLSPILRVYEGCARSYLGEIEDANVVKLHRFSGKISYLACPQFDTDAHPAIRRTIKLSLRDLYLQCIDDSTNNDPLLLDQKEKMVDVDHKLRGKFEKLSVREAKIGVLAPEAELRTLQTWNEQFQQFGVSLSGHRLTIRKPVKDASAATNSVFPKRSKRFGIGKEIGGAVYVHRDYEIVLGPSIENAKSRLPVPYDYDIVKFGLRDNNVSFIWCPDFDTNPEPYISQVYLVKSDGSARFVTQPRDPSIYHHKWMFVAPDYGRFDVTASEERSRKWLSIPNIDKSKIGRRNYWLSNVVPQIDSIPRIAIESS